MMLSDTQMLQSIYQQSQMGCYGIGSVFPYTPGTPLNKALTEQLAEYRSIAKQSAQLLTSLGQTPEGTPAIAKLSARAMSWVKTKLDHSPGKIAEMMIQGNTMGVTKSLRHLHSYSAGNTEVAQLAQRLLQTEQNNIEQMKPYL